MKDAEQMIPRTKTKLDRALEELEDLVVRSPTSVLNDLSNDGDADHVQNTLSSDAEIKGSTEWQVAFSQLQQIEASRKADGN